MSKGQTPYECSNLLTVLDFMSQIFCCLQSELPNLHPADCILALQVAETQLQLHSIK